MIVILPSSEGYLYAAIIVGCAVLVHSLYLHRFKYNTVRVVTDLAALFLALEGAFFLPCTVNQQCSNANLAVLNGVFANCICGGIVQVIILNS